MKKITLIGILSIMLLLLGACGKVSKVEDAYGKFEYDNADGSKAYIIIEKDEITFDNVNIDELKKTKVAFEVQKEVTRQEQKGNSLSDEDKTELEEKYNQEIDWNSFINASFQYNAEYEEDTQAVYFESATGNQNELFFTYDLKYKTITIYNTEFTKTSDETN